MSRSRSARPQRISRPASPFVGAPTLPTVRALLYGVRPDPVDVPDDPSHPLLAGLARTPMRLADMDDPGFLLPDWGVTNSENCS